MIYSSLKVLFLAAEAAPFFKVGGLGDVAGALPAALQSLPEKPEVRVVLPLHGAFDQHKFALEKVMDFALAAGGSELAIAVHATIFEGVQIYFVLSPGWSAAAPVYQADPGKDAYKYACFSLAALEFCRKMQWQPDIVHANDWHTALAVYSLRQQKKVDAFFKRTSSLLTIHNLPYQGHGAEPALQRLGIPAASDAAVPEWARQVPMAMGLAAADWISAVSPGYAREILTPEFGAGLEELLRTRTANLTGILNGLDIDKWNPASDANLKTNYRLRDFVGARKKNKHVLQMELGLAPNSGLPLLAMIGRVDVQKGVDLAMAALESMLDDQWQFVILGTGDPDLEQSATQFAERFPQRVRAIIGYDDALARGIYAGADAILIPSRYEPCGLTQMIAMRYGCIPIAQAVGGLADTIRDVDESGGAATGFLIQSLRVSDIAQRTRHALAKTRDTRFWRGLQRRGMRADFSWDNSAHEYHALYQHLMERQG